MCNGSKIRSTVPSGNKSTHLPTGRHLHPWIQGMRNAVRKVSKFVLQLRTQIKTKRNPTSHLPVHGSCHTGPYPPITINAHVAVNAPEPAPHTNGATRYLHNCNDLSPHQSLDTFPSQLQRGENKMRTAVQKASSCSRQTMTKTKQNPTSHLSVQGPNMFSIPIAPHVSFTGATRCVQVHFDAEFYTQLSR